MGDTLPDRELGELGNELVSRVLKIERDLKVLAAEQRLPWQDPARHVLARNLVDLRWSRESRVLTLKVGTGADTFVALDSSKAPIFVRSGVLAESMKQPRALWLWLMGARSECPGETLPSGEEGQDA